MVYLYCPPALRVSFSDPDNSLAPLRPSKPTQDEAFVEDQVKVTGTLTEVFKAEIETATVGAGLETGGGVADPPPPPPQATTRVAALAAKKGRANLVMNISPINLL